MAAISQLKPALYGNLDKNSVEEFDNNADTNPNQ